MTRVPTISNCKVEISSVYERSGQSSAGIKPLLNGSSAWDSQIASSENKAVASHRTPHRRRAVAQVVLIGLVLGVAIASMAGSALAQRTAGRPGAITQPGPTRIITRPTMHRRFHIYRPYFPIYEPPQFGFWGWSYFSPAPVWQFNLPGREYCGPFWGWMWGSSCYEWPTYVLEGGGRELPQLYLKDGTVYNVTDYWLVDNQLHFTTLDESGTKWAEHTIEFDQLDLQKTVDVARQRGFNFVLRNEPLAQYLRDHPDVGAPEQAQPAPKQ